MQNGQILERSTPGAEIHMTPSMRDALPAALQRDTLLALKSAVVEQVSSAARSGKLLIVGSARLPRRILAGARAAGGDARAFIEIDPRYWGKDVDGVPVMSPAEALALAGADATIIVGIWSPNHMFTETEAWLKAHGARTILPVEAAFWAWSGHIGAHYQFGPPDIYAERAGDVLKLHDSLFDDVSKAQFAGVMQRRLSLSSARLPLGQPRAIYFDPAISRMADDAVVADVGAYAGDTLDVFLYWQGRRFGTFVAFEPDPLSFGRLRQFHEGLTPAVRSKIELVQAGVGDAPGVIRLTPTGMPGTQSGAVGEVEVPCITLDDHFQGRRVGYIKVDVEGFEPQVMAGARRIVAEDRPILGLSVYHSPTDLLDVPLDLIGRLTDYTYHFRAHDDDGIDFIFYAVPNERRGSAFA
jgi:FkbM family methyltransferase